ncbi:MAG: DEAD/DEAH box helicase family protein [Bacilli bacterium]|jgi:competence protein ComFA|nr:DEAD/DEAH box helicase family protein [Bacilli bacterium]
MFNYKIDFVLNENQQDCSNLLNEYFNKKEHILLDAVCGAGKTEMLLKTINNALNKNLLVGLACPRKELLKDLYRRVSAYFNNSDFGLICGDVKKNINSNFIFLTTHQLVNCNKIFDLLIIDEIDAFPFYNNFNLEQAALQKGKQFIFLSASVPFKYYDLIKRDKLKLVSNYTRFHQQKMPVPKIIKTRGLVISIIKYCFKNTNQQIILFVSSLKKGYKYERLLRIFGFKVKFVYSKNISQAIINQFRNKEYQILISTTVLERGYTFKNINVLIIEADNALFDEATLLQIAGRVGRDYQYHQGHIIMFAHKITQSMIACTKRIEGYNEMLNM